MTERLFGRATLRPRLDPLDYRDAARFVGDPRPEAAIRRYAVLGGTPQYQVWAGALPLPRVIRERILERGAPLYEEPLHLLRQGEGVRTPATPLGPAESAARATYELADPFFRFWFRYVFPRRSRLERGRVDEVYAEIDRDLDTFMGAAFEECCRAWLGAYAGASRVGELDEIGSWMSRDGRTEIDVVGVRRGRYTFLGSCKWRGTADVDVLDDLLTARDTMGKAGRARLAIFARESFSARLRERAADEDVMLVSAADLFAA